MHAFAWILLFGWHAVPHRRFSRQDMGGSVIVGNAEGSDSRTVGTAHNGVKDFFHALMLLRSRFSGHFGDTIEN